MSHISSKQTKASAKKAFNVNAIKLTIPVHQTLIQKSVSFMYESIPH